VLYLEASRRFMQHYHMVKQQTEPDLPSYGVARNTAIAIGSSRIARHYLKQRPLRSFGSFVRTFG
jgi:hypothetical protein